MNSRPGPPCPVCSERTRTTSAGLGDEEHELDVCTHCHFVWFDPGEDVTVEWSMAEPVTDGPSPDAHARGSVDIDDDAEKRETPLQWATALFGLPVEHDTPSSGTTKPWATWTIAAAIVVVSSFAFLDFKWALSNLALVPAEFLSRGGLNILTASFVHGGFYHLLGNVYFLVVFGDDVEDFLGPARFLLLLLVATVAGSLLHVAFDPSSMTPVIGASDGISGVIAFYALRFPHARIGRFFFGTFYFRITAWQAFGVWVVMQLFLAYRQHAGTTSVSAASHLGGALAGLALWAFWRRREARAP